MQSVLGPFPTRMLTAPGTDAAKYFTPAGVVYEAAEDGAVSLMHPVRSSLALRSGAEDPLWLDFIASLLAVDPQARPTAAQALQHPWLAQANVLPFEPYVMP